MEEPSTSKVKRLKKTINTMEIAMEKAQRRHDIVRQQEEARRLAEIRDEEVLHPKVIESVLSDACVIGITEHCSKDLRQ